MSDTAIFCPSLTDAFAQTGFAFQSEPSAGKLLRFSTNERDKFDKFGWLRLFSDGDGAVFGCWRQGVTFTWQRRADGAPEPSQEERQALRIRSEQVRLQAEGERAKGHSEAATKAKQIWSETLDPNPSHGYLDRKGIKPHASRLDLNGRLVLPIYSADGKIQSLQLIDTRGEKKLLFGAAAKYGRLFVGVPVDGEPLVLCEGFATGASIHEPKSGDQTINSVIT